jgi:hypothetical protein
MMNALDDDWFTNNQSTTTSEIIDEATTPPLEDTLIQQQDTFVTSPYSSSSSVESLENQILDDLTTNTPITPTHKANDDDDDVDNVNNEGIAQNTQHLTITIDTNDITHQSALDDVDFNAPKKPTVSSPLPPVPSHLVRKTSPTVLPPIPRAVLSHRWAYQIHDKKDAVTIRLLREQASILLNFSHGQTWSVVSQTRSIIVSDDHQSDGILKSVTSQKQEQEIVIGSAGSQQFSCFNLQPDSQDINSLIVRVDSLVVTSPSVELRISTSVSPVAGFCELSNRNDNPTSSVPVILSSKGSLVEKTVAQDQEVLVNSDHLIAYASTLHVIVERQVSDNCIMKYQQNSGTLVALSGKGKYYLSL